MAVVILCGIDTSTARNIVPALYLRFGSVRALAARADEAALGTAEALG